MKSQLLESVKEDLKAIEPMIDEAEELIAALKEVGEPTQEMESELRTLKIRRTKWQNMLQARGYGT